MLGVAAAEAATVLAFKMSMRNIMDMNRERDSNAEDGEIPTQVQSANFSLVNGTNGGRCGVGGRWYSGFIREKTL